MSEPGRLYRDTCKNGEIQGLRYFLPALPTDVLNERDASGYTGVHWAGYYLKYEALRIIVACKRVKLNKVIALEGIRASGGDPEVRRILMDAVDARDRTESAEDVTAVNQSSSEKSHANLFTPLYILIFLFIARYFLKAGSSDTWADNLIPWSLTDLILWSRNIDSFDLVFWLAVGLCLYAMWISGVTRSHSQASVIQELGQLVSKDRPNHAVHLSPSQSDYLTRLINASSNTGILKPAWAALKGAFFPARASDGWYYVTWPKAMEGLPLATKKTGEVLPMVIGSSGTFKATGTLAAGPAALAVVPAMIFQLMTMVTAQLHVVRITESLRRIEGALAWVKARMDGQSKGRILAAINALQTWFQLPDRMRPDFFGTHSITLQNIDTELHQQRHLLRFLKNEGDALELNPTCGYNGRRMAEFQAHVDRVKANLEFQMLAVRAKLVWTVLGGMILNSNGADAHGLFAAAQAEIEKLKADRLEMHDALHYKAARYSVFWLKRGEPVNVRARETLHGGIGGLVDVNSIPEIGLAGAVRVRVQDGKAQAVKCA